MDRGAELLALGHGEPGRFTAPVAHVDQVVIRGRAVEFVEGAEADRCMDQLAKKYVGTDRFEWRIPGEQRVKILVEPTRVRHVVGVEPFRRGILPSS